MRRPQAAGGREDRAPNVDLDSLIEPDADHSSCDQLEPVEKGGQGNGRLPLGASKLLELQAVSDETDIALIGMQQIHRPVFGLIAVVPKGACEFELESPPAGDQEVRSTPGSHLRSRPEACGRFERVPRSSLTSSLLPNVTLSGRGEQREPRTVGACCGAAVRDSLDRLVGPHQERR